MRGFCWAWFLLVVAPMSGCLEASNPLSLRPGTVPVDSLPVLEGGNSRIVGTEPLFWSGKIEASDGTSTFPVHFIAPSKYWEGHGGGLEVSIAWSHQTIGAFSMQVLDGAGHVAARGMNGWFASVASLDQAASGDYQVAVQGGGRESVFDGAVRVVSSSEAPGPVHDLLPDLVTLTPSDLRVQDPGFPYPSPGVVSHSCGVDEVVEAQARRCLRLSNAMGNAGEGPLEVHLAIGDGVKAPAGMGYWVQRIHRSDGTYHDERVGPAAFHATHGHFHYQGFAHFQVFHYDWDKRVRGDPLNTGRKNGFCFFDIGLVELGKAGTLPPQFNGRACLDPTQGEEWFMGLSPNWFDFYSWDLPDQYVDISGAPDGVYELVSRANGAGTLIEKDSTDNEASTMFQLAGDTVKVLWPSPSESTIR